MNEINNITLEQVHRWLVASDDTFPTTGSVLDAIVDPSDNSIIAKWIDDEDEEVYRDAIADTRDPNAAKRVYQFEPKICFTRVWLNDDGSGKQIPSAQRLTDQDVHEISQRMRKAKLRRPGNAETAWVTE